MKFILDTEEKRRALIEYIGSLPLTQYVVKVEKENKKRSTPQNRLYFAWLRLLAEDTGNDVETMHHYFAKKYLGTQVHEVDGMLIERPISTAGLDKKVFGEYLDRIHAWAAAQRIQLPQPEDAIFEEFFEQYDR